MSRVQIWSTEQTYPVDINPSKIPVTWGTRRIHQGTEYKFINGIWQIPSRIDLEVGFKDGSIEHYTVPEVDDMEYLMGMQKYNQPNSWAVAMEDERKNEV